MKSASATSSASAKPHAAGKHPTDAPAAGRLIGVDARAGFIDLDSAALNMAVDQTLLESVDRTGIPCLRIYRWCQPTLSLGYFQKYDHRHSHHESLDLPCVRRASGGGAIVHHHELTYSIAIPNNHPSIAKEARAPSSSLKNSISLEFASDSSAPQRSTTSIGANGQLYTLVHHGIAQAVGEFGVTAVPYRSLQTVDSEEILSHATEPVLCFQRRTREDLIVAGYKILGSAQRRGKRSLLQHGSLLIRASSHAPQLPGIIDLGAEITAIEQLIKPITQQLAAILNIDWLSAEISDSERQQSETTAAARFASADWTKRR